MTKHSKLSALLRKFGQKAKERWSVLANRREGRIWAATCSDLALFLVLASSAGAILLTMIIYLSAIGKIAAVPTVTAAVAVFSAVGAVVAYCVREANRRVTSVDIFIGDIQAQLSLVGFALRSDSINNTSPDAEESSALKDALLSLDALVYDKMISRMDDLLRMQVRFVAAYYTEVRSAKERLTQVDGVKPATDVEIYATAFRVMKRGVKAVEKLTDVDEKEGFEKFKNKTSQLRNKLEKIGETINGDFDLHRKYALQFKAE